MTKEEQKQIATTILSQLGGNKFKVMTGAKNFSYNDNGDLTFRFPRQKGLMYCRVSLNSMDLYDMEFMNNKGAVKVEYNGIYNDQLQELFTQATGLYTSL